MSPSDSMTEAPASRVAVTEYEAAGDLPTPMTRPRAAFARFADYARGTRLALAGVAALTCISPVVEVGQLWLFKDIINSASARAGLSRYVLLAGLFGALAVVEGIGLYAAGVVGERVSQGLIRRLRTDFFAHVQSLSPHFFERRPLGDILSRLTNDVEAVEAFLFSGLVAAVTSVGALGIGVVALFVLDWRLTLISAAVIPLFFLLSRLFRNRMNAAAHVLQRSEGEVNSAGEQALSNAMLVQAYNRAQWETRRFDDVGRRRFVAEMIAVRLRSLFTPLVDLVETVGAMVVLGFGVWDLQSGRLSLGALVAFVALLSRIYLPVSTLTGLMAEFYTATASADRLTEFLDERPSVRDPAVPVALPGQGRIELQRVRFHYPGRARDALAGIDLTVPAGRTVAIVGASGSGKSTLIKLLLRFYDPTCGSVRLDGVDLRDASVAAVRNEVAVLLQENFVLDGSIADNIGYGRVGASPAQIESAARAAGVHEFAMALPDGYRTVVGQRGRALSGGQRQRVALARALVREPTVLILDEPTTGLDRASAIRLLDALRADPRPRTTLIVTHDLDAARHADEIVLLDGGRVMESGTHEQLLHRDGAYARLCRIRPSAVVGTGGPGRLAVPPGRHRTDPRDDS